MFCLAGSSCASQQQQNYTKNKTGEGGGGSKKEIKERRTEGADKNILPCLYTSRKVDGKINSLLLFISYTLQRAHFVVTHFVLHNGYLDRFTRRIDSAGSENQPNVTPLFSTTEILFSESARSPCFPVNRLLEEAYTTLFPQGAFEVLVLYCLRHDHIYPKDSDTFAYKSDS